MTLKLKFQSLTLILVLATSPFLCAAGEAPQHQAVQQKTFASPEDAAKALTDALRAQDRNMLLTVLGSKADTWLSSGDEVADRNDQGRFLAAYDIRNSVTLSTEGRAVLVVGEDGWPFPAPIVRQGSGWHFDALAGREEIINRRIGRNELNTIQTLLAVVDAQREYAMKDLDGNGFNDYAQRFLSSDGKKDGLFWPVQGNQLESPLGPQIAAAARQGYGKLVKVGKPGAYHGYRFRMLSAQGKEAQGGAYSYLAGNKMIGGFAAVAYPVKYGVSGIMTFMVSHDGLIYEKNQGKASEHIALRMAVYNPDKSWRKTR